MLVYSSVGLASAISGAAVALQLAPALPTGEYFARRDGAATMAAAAAAPTDKPGRAATALPSAAPATAANGSGIGSAPSSKPAALLPTSATAPLDERQLTFAWGYAQRHPGALSRRAELHAASASASTRTERVARIAKREPRHPAEQQRTSAASRNTLGFAPSQFGAGLDGDPHQVPGYAEQRYANGFRTFSRVQSLTGPRHHSPSPPPRA